MSVTVERLVPTIRYGLVVRISGFHPGGSGSIPGTGTFALSCPCGQLIRKPPLHPGLVRPRTVQKRESSFEPDLNQRPMDTRN